MRVKRIRIGKWRNFEDVEVNFDDGVPLVCVVGANGTGKTHLLELVAACAHHLGLSAGIELSRGNPFADEHDFEITLQFSEEASAITALSSFEGFGQWHRTLTLKSNKKDGHRIEAENLQPPHKTTFVRNIVTSLRKSKDVHFLFLDADRAYPKKDLNPHEVAEAYGIDWDELTRGSSYKPTRTLYDEWIKYFLSQENQAATSFMQEHRRASSAGTAPPEFIDHFSDYTMSLQKVLPHLLFRGVDNQRRTLLFDTAGSTLNFNQLSGGEREIAFLIGQIDRFHLRQGLFLIDEPELHLNADLIRAWVTFLVGTVSVGQIWLATHSLEAAEAAGQKATYILERDEASRKVVSMARLDSRPVLSALSRAVGTPAFSITQLQFIFIEGEEGIGEREKFRRLINGSQDVRFSECGCCNEVLRRVSVVKSLAKEAETEIRIGGVIDRDWRTSSECGDLARNGDVFVLPVHEVENFFLHPATLLAIVQQMGRKDVVEDLVREAADARAGSWIFQHAMSTRNARSLPEIAKTAKEKAKNLSFNAFDSNPDATLNLITEASGFEDPDKKKLADILKISLDSYKQKRTAPDLWKHCEGKQVLIEIARAVGITDAKALQTAVFAAWESGRAAVPEELQSLREYVNGV